MLLPDHEIHSMIRDKIIGYTPYDEKFLNPASIDMTLNSLIRVPVREPFGAYPTLDCKEIAPNHTRIEQINPGYGYGLTQGSFILASTNESVKLPDDLVARVEGKSSLGRLGVAVHITAGFIDPGFEGQVTLEIANLGPWIIRLHPDMRIAQIAFQTMTDAASKSYADTGHYQAQVGPTESRYRME